MRHQAQRKRPQFVLVSGAAGGVGSATARRFREDGAEVAITDIDEDGLRRIVDEIDALAVPADGTKRDALKEAVERTVAQFGALDTLIAAQGATSSGIASPKGDGAWFRALDVNLTGAFFLASEALPHLVRRRGSIVMISSTAGIFAGPPGTVGYTAAKSGVIGLVRWLARDFGPRGVRVNAICPGWVRTALADDAMAYLARRDGITPEEAYRVAASHVPLRRAADPDEIASVCAFLASADASMVTGHALVVDGGSSVVDPTTIVLDPPADDFERNRA
jgi:NAD(P)-dependent dehydrogenase (short-subunit alcohol dehydrogenase family)